jgi:hypothetical protein
LLFSRFSITSTSRICTVRRAFSASS